MVIYITLAVAILSGIYSFHYVRRHAGKKITNRTYLALALSALVYAAAKTLGEPTLYSFIRAVAIVIIFYACGTVPLLVAGLAEDLCRGLRRLIFGKRTFRPSKWLFAAACLGALAGIATVTEGILHGKTDYRVYPFTMESPRIPAAFDGLRIVQLSDLHLGSFRPDDPHLPRVFDTVRALRPDLIVLTGDILNDNSADMLPWMDHLSGLSAPLGKYAVIGNHDYCEYDRSLSPSELQEQMDSLFSYYRRAGFRVLDNETVPFAQDGDTLYLAGVENWGVGPFPARGDLDKAVRGIPQDGFTILLSHDPAHFERIVSKYPRFIDLTLSGHTHAMQFAFQFTENFQWSPIQYRDKYWAGPYRENGRQLYVSRGVGYHFFPARVGMRPEITLITLEKTEK